MEYKIYYSNESIIDLFRIYDYIANFQNEQANALKLIDAIRTGVTYSLTYRS